MPHCSGYSSAINSPLSNCIILETPSKNSQQIQNRETRENNNFFPTVICRPFHSYIFLQWMAGMGRGWLSISLFTRLLRRASLGFLTARQSQVIQTSYMAVGLPQSERSKRQEAKLGNLLRSGFRS